ncbi:MAG: UDP-N-acetylmuramoyl-L-alanine--D-glutamate ligase [Candidatus Paceibacterota bacterium]
MERQNSKKELDFKGKKVLVFGLGLLGGGVATTNWLIKHGAVVTVTDLKDKDQLEHSLENIKGKVKLSLGGHKDEDIKDNDIIVINPDVPINNRFVELARKLGKTVENEATIFYKSTTRPIIAITGTRGKTTTANWAGHFLKAKKKTIVTGNSYIEPMMKALDKVGKYSVVVNELPSFQLELFDEVSEAPEIAVITNIYQDHLNRHGSLRNYANTKANIFRSQSSDQNLILNYDNDWTEFFLKQKPKSKIWFFSLLTLPKQLNGVFYKDDTIYFQSNREVKKALDVKGFIEKWGGHNLQNLLVSSLAAHLGGISWPIIQKNIKTLPQVPFRQEVIFENEQIRVVNDTAATSPDGGIAAVKRFGSPSCVLITGGTDRQLDYSQWAKVVPKFVKPENIIMIDGSATGKMLAVLGSKGHKIRVFNTLEECVVAALSRLSGHSGATLLFSPASKSFEKFKNEYDRGDKFNKLIGEKLK